MRKLILCFSVCFLSFSYLIIKAQEEDPRIWYNAISVPPSPNAASLGKYGEYLVDKSTGIPNISVPLFDISEGGIDVGVGISYHAGGIKVQEEASCIGLGWSLNAGGVITRVMHGMPDDAGTYGYLNHASKIPREAWVDADFTVPEYEERTYQWLNQLSLVNIDYEPDIFYYNIGQHSGSFIFGNHGDIVLMPISDLSIKPIYDTVGTHKGIAGFIIIDPNGMEYLFGDIDTTGYIEKTLAFTGNGDINYYVSSYYLYKISNPFRASSILFKYKNYNNYNNYRKTMPASYTMLYESNPPNPHYYYVSSSSSDCDVIINMKALSLIEFKNDSISFYSSISDENLPKIDSIVFKARKFSFNYDWFNSNGQSNYRLKLLSIIESGTGNTDKIHSFKYNDIDLPEYESFAIDHWGYYNHALNQSLIPNIQIGNQTLGGGSNREPNCTYTKGGTLDTIIYPTGGRTEFEFESNTASRLPIPEEIARDSTLEYLIELENNEHEVLKTFYINLDPNLIYFDINVHAELSGRYCECPPQGDACGGTWDLTNANNEAQSLNLPTYVPCAFSKNKSLESNFFIPPLILDLALSSFDAAKFTVKITFKYYDPNDLLIKRPFITGGTRIRKIVNFDPVTANSTIRSFDYGQGGNLNAHEPISYYTSITDVRPNPPDPQLISYPQKMVFSSAQTGLGVSPNIVSYDEVTEYLGTNENNTGKIVSSYYKIDDPSTSGPPYPPKISYQYLRTNLTKELYYSFVDTGYRLVKSNAYSYEFDTSRMNHILGFQAFRKRTAPVQEQKKEDFNFRNYWIESNLLRKNIITSTEYFNIGSELVNVDTLIYDSIHYINPKEIKSLRSDGKIITTRYKYPIDYLTCYDACSQQFANAIETCEHNYRACSREFQNCISKYNNCRNITYDCIYEAQEELDDCPNVPVLYELCQQKVIRKFNNCLEKISYCLDTSGYNSCLATDSCYYIGCVVDVSNTYNYCIDNYETCIIDQYDNTTDDNERAIILLAQLHNNNALIEKEVYVDQSKIEHFKFNYKTNTLEFADEDTTIIVDFPIIYSADKANINDVFYQEMRYDEYDSHFNIVQMTPKGLGPSIVFLWGYNYTSLIAEIDNSTLSEVLTALHSINSNINNLDDLQPLNQVSLHNLFSQLRLILRNSLITSFTYDPYIGIKSKTDPNNITTYYDYDSFGRLQTIKDSQMNVIKRYVYNYHQ